MLGNRAPGADEAASSILGFIVGFALLAGSMAAVAYVLTSTADAGADDEASRQLDGHTRWAVQGLVDSEGTPSDWHTPSDSDLWNDPIEQIGLLRGTDGIASLEKIERFQDGSVNSTILTRSNNLLADDVVLDAEASVVPVSSMRPPSSTTYAVANGTVGSDLDDVSVTTTSSDTLDLYASANDGFEQEVHGWTFRWSEAPDTGLGNTFVDNAWHVHTQMLPKTVGVEATYTVEDPNAHGGSNSTAATAAMSSFNGGDEKLTRWHVASHGEPKKIPHTSDVNEGLGDHALTVGYCKETGPNKDCNDTGNGDGAIGHWRVTDGMRSWALLGKVDATGAGTANLTFDHLLKVNGDEDTECHTKDSKTNCIEIRPAIRFWNDTANGGDGAWTRLDDDAACNPSPAWNDTGDAEVTSKWERKTVDLCEAVENGTSDIWITLEWYTQCYGLVDGVATDCAGELSEEPGTRAWFVDNLEIDTDGEAEFETDFEPGGDLENVVASHGVDPSFHQGAGQTEDLVGPVRHFVKNGGNVLAFEPAKEGNWLGAVGLEADRREGPRHTETLLPDTLVMRMPYELPTDDDFYDAGDVGWFTGSNPSSESSASLTGREALGVVQNTTPDSGSVATLITGVPYTDGGRVTGVAYDVTDLNDTDTRDELIENLHTSTVFLDPTFSTDGRDVADAGDVPVTASSRVTLAEVTRDGDHQVPIEVTVFAWPQGVG